MSHKISVSLIHRKWTNKGDGVRAGAGRGERSGRRFASETASPRCLTKMLPLEHLVYGSAPIHSCQGFCSVQLGKLVFMAGVNTIPI